MKKSIYFFGLALMLSAFIHAQTKSEYKIANKFSVKGEGGWDYLTMDDATGRLFVSHGTEVNVVDVKTGKTIATISDLKGVHGIAIASEFNKGFITNGRDSSVTIFDLKTYEKTANVKVTGGNPDAILYDPFSKKVFVYNGRSSNATVLDAATNKIVGTIALDGKPEFSVTDEKGKVYVNIEDKSEISMINSTTLKVEQTWSIKPGEEPSGLALDNNTHRLFTVTDKLMVILDAQNGKVIATLPIGERVDGVAFDPGMKRAYSSNGDGTVTVVQEENENTFKVLENIPTQKGARTIAVDKKTHHLYLPTAEFGETPEKTKENPRPRPSVKPNSFVILDVQPAE
ncbi:MAG: YncE family protein [Bacteroidia bacterium]